MESAIKTSENSGSLYVPALFCALSVAGAFLLAELVEINRITRLWLHDVSFLRYQLLFALLLWVFLAVYTTHARRHGKLSTLKLVGIGIMAALFCATIAFISLPWFSGRGIATNLISWQGWTALIAAVGLSLSWLTGMLAGLLGSALFQGKKRMVLSLISTCVLVKIIEATVHYHFGERIW